MRWLHEEFQPGLKSQSTYPGWKLIAITWRISTRAENIDLKGNFSPGWKSRREWIETFCFSPGWTRSHEKFSARLGLIPACLDRAGPSPRLSGLKLFPCNRNYFLLGLWPHGWDIGKTDSCVLYGKVGWRTCVVLQHRCYHMSLKKFCKVWVAITLTSQSVSTWKKWVDI